MPPSTAVGTRHARSRPAARARGGTRRPPGCRASPHASDAPGGPPPRELFLLRRQLGRRLGVQAGQPRRPQHVQHRQQLLTREGHRGLWESSSVVHGTPFPPGSIADRPGHVPTGFVQRAAKSPIRRTLSARRARSLIALPISAASGPSAVSSMPRPCAALRPASQRRRPIRRRPSGRPGFLPLPSGQPATPPPPPPAYRSGPGTAAAFSAALGPRHAAAHALAHAPAKPTPW